MDPNALNVQTRLENEGVKVNGTNGSMTSLLKLKKVRHKLVNMESNYLSRVVLVLITVIKN